MSLDLILKINFFFILVDGIVAFLKNVYREGIKIYKKFSRSCWVNFLKIFSSSLLRRIFQKWPSPPISTGGRTFLKKIIFASKKFVHLLEKLKKNVNFSKHEQHKGPEKLSMPGMIFLESARQIRVKPKPSQHVESFSCTVWLRSFHRKDYFPDQKIFALDQKFFSSDRTFGYKLTYRPKSFRSNLAVFFWDHTEK